jgi:hypothetical protein
MCPNGGDMSIYFDYETERSYAISVLATDTGQPPLSKEVTFTIDITDSLYCIICICINQKLWKVMVNNSTNINKMNNHLSPLITEHEKYHDIWRWKFQSWLGTGTKCGRVIFNWALEPLRHRCNCFIWISCISSTLIWLVILFYRLGRHVYLWTVVSVS